MRRVLEVLGSTALLLMLVVGVAGGQVNTGSVTGTVSDNTGAVMPGVTVSLSGQSLIGGVQTQVSDSSGAYRFDRLPPGSYNLKYELQGFKTVERSDIRVSATFTATVNVQLEVGAVEQTVTVAGESPTVDTKSNVQQTVMSQEILEGVPTGRDPWSLAKIIPGVLVSTYDVGGTQSYQQSNMTAHGSLNADKTFSIDGMTINWPGGDGGATMIYYDQGMFEEVNYQTSAIPAEVAIGGIYMNMVTKNAGNTWRGDVRYTYANDSLQSNNATSDYFKKYGFTGGNPIISQYDFSVSAGGALIKDKLWVNGAYRVWQVDKNNFLAKNPDGTPTIDDNWLVNYSGKGQYQVNRDHRVSFSYNWNNKDRGHRRDPPPNFVEDKASLHQTNPGSTSQARYTGIFGKAVFESSFSYMLGVTNYFYQDDVKDTDIRIVDNTLSTALGAAPRHEELPNSRVQFDNTLSFSKEALGGLHNAKVGVQYARLYMNDQFWVNGDEYIVFNNNEPNSVQIFNTPVANKSYVKWLGFFAQDSWSIDRLTLNVGVRFDRATTLIPAQTAPAGTFVGARSINETEPSDQRIFVWRLGAVYDPFGKGKTAIKASYSRYGQQVGLNRVQIVHPFQFSSGTRTWTDSNLDRIPQLSELGPFSGFPEVTNHYADSNGPDWPYSNEIVAGLEHQLVRDVRLSVMYYHRENRKQTGFRNMKVPSSAYTPVTVNVPGSPTGPGGSVTFYNLDPAFFGSAFLDNTYDAQPLLNTDYNGVEFTMSKRFSGRWQALGGLTFGKNEGGAVTGDLNDPNNFLNYPKGIVGDDSKYAFRLAGSYLFPWDIDVSGTLISNGGYPYQSTYSISRTVYPTLTRSTQVVRLSARGDERLPNVTMVDLRISRAFKYSGSRRIAPQVEIFNIGNASTVVRYNPAVGGSYLAPAEILSPRVVRVGFSMTF